MIRLNRPVIALLAAVLIAAPATANDTIASMGAGGLVFQRTDGIEMRSEDLYVSAREIRVRYRFYNRTDHDIATLVAFPLPDLPGGIESDVAIEDPLRMPFRTTVNGRRVSTNIEQKAVLGGVDHTDLVRGLGLPLSPRGDATQQALLTLPRPQVEMMIEMGMLVDRSWTDAGVRHIDLVPQWTLKTTHYWTQVFPAGRDLDVRHSYIPAVGGSSGSPFGDPESEAGEWGAEHGARYCADDAFRNGARRMRTRGLSLSETWLDYILTTGANWAEPIGDFRMVVDKGSSRNLMSFCGEGVRKISATRYEIRRRDFIPTHDLSVVILSGERIRD
jgi:hypothetical protein